MNRYKTVNNLVGWITFAIAAFVYCSTIEPSASYWDCPEFITTGYKLEIGHPPGAPFFMLTANLFSQFAQDPSHVAMMVNVMSALMSAACILFLFWSITHLARKLIVRDGENPTTAQLIEVIGAGVVGALAYTFSDTFWFSAVEGEVYAYSSMFTAVVFWLILKWEERADQPHSDRWLVLISFLTGLSIGVHLLNLLCIPAIVLVYCYKHRPDLNAKGSLLALLVSFVIVGVVLYGVVPGIVKVGGWFELLFVNTLGFSFNTGLIVYIILLVACVLWAIWESQKGTNRRNIVISSVLSVGFLGIPFYGSGASSVILGIIVLAALFVVLRKRNKKNGFLVSARVVNTTLLCFLMLMIGYSTYAVIVIRSTANPPMDQNSPEDIFTLGSYLNREQYGSRPLFYGNAYTSQPEFESGGDGMLYWKRNEGKAIYNRKEKDHEGEKDSYVVVGHDNEYVYAQNMLFPRMHSADHRNAYESWMGGVEGREVPYNDPTGRVTSVKMPTQWENLKFFVSYQLNFMYWRYFMWNFAGRQNDIQGYGEKEHGNWITGIPLIDNLRLGDQDLLPDSLKNNKGHNVFYGLPLLLGIIGLLWQAYRGQKGIQQFWIVFFLFFMTGIAIVLYLNQTPSQPRERDYAYAGSFYAFAIWIGMGVAGLIQLLSKWMRGKAAAQAETSGESEEAPELKPSLAVALIVSVVCLLIPIQMASQTWDDHDRSDRYMARDFGQNYLMSLQESGNPIIYTNGDNDTFPLWYNQETEGFRTDARTCNLSYLNTDWYIDQMKRPAYDSPSLPITWDRMDYVEGTNEYITVQPEYKKSIDALYAQAEKEALAGNPEAKINVQKEFGENPYELKNILKYWVRNKNKELQVIPTDSVVIKVDKEAVRRSGMLLPGDSIPDYMPIKLRTKDSQGNYHPKRALYKSELMMLEMLAEANWERPIYIAVSVGQENQLGLDNYFIQEGLAYRFTPFDTNKTGVKIDSEKMYDNLMNKFKFGGIGKPGIYIDENAMRMCYSHRRIFAQLIGQLLAEGKNDKARAALEYAEKMIPAENVPYDWQNGSLQMAEAWYKLGEMEKGDHIAQALADKAVEYMTWYMSLDEGRFMISSREFEYHWALLSEEVKKMEQYKSPLAETYRAKLEELYEMYVNRMKR